MNCIHCDEIIDEDRLWFLNLNNRPYTCQNCSMEPTAKGYVKKIKPKKKKKIVKITQKQHIVKLGREEYEKYKSGEGGKNAFKINKLLYNKDSRVGASYFFYVLNFVEKDEFKPEYDNNYRAVCLACLLLIKDKTDELIQNFEEEKDELDKHKKVG